MTTGTVVMHFEVRIGSNGMKELFKAAGNGYISDSYAKQLYSDGKPFTNELKAGFGSTDRTQELIAFFEGNITDAAGVLVDFGIPGKTDCDKKSAMRCFDQSNAEID